MVRTKRISFVKQPSRSYDAYPLAVRSAGLQVPLTLLHAAIGHPMLCELKSGETYNGILDACDSFMNLKLIRVICTSKLGDRFWSLPECYIRGPNVKFMRIQDEVVDIVQEDEQRQREAARGADGGEAAGAKPTLSRGGARGGARGGGSGGGGRGGGGDRGGRGGRGGGRGGRGGGRGGERGGRARGRA